jgi:uncharacterized membrane protein YhaH (DUF805 family)
MSFGTAIATGLRKYADFSGVASRSEFWWFNLFLVLGSLVAGVFGDGGSFVWFLVTVLPYLAVGVRRLRDADLAWGLIFIGLALGLGTIVMIVLWLQPTKVVAEEIENTPSASV